MGKNGKLLIISIMHSQNMMTIYSFLLGIFDDLTKLTGPFKEPIAVVVF